MTFVTLIGMQFHPSPWIDEYLSKNVPCEQSSLKKRFYRNLGIAWSPPASSAPRFRDRLRRLIKNPARVGEVLKERFVRNRQQTFATIKGQG